jgi:hypothetical protein
MIIDYEILENEQKDKLVSLVKQHIQSGWQPYESLVVKTDRVGRGADVKDVQKYCQPMVKLTPPLFFNAPPIKLTNTTEGGAVNEG